MKYQSKIAVVVFVLFYGVCIIPTPITRSLTDSLLVVVLMVKNEASVIKETLQPFVEGGVKQFVVFDTGSDDNTPEIARQFFDEHHISQAHIVKESFIDFATSRNHALNSAQHLFPEATFMVMPDAEWYIHNAKHLLEFCEDHKNHTDTCYFISIRSTNLAFVTPRLIRCRKNVRFVGVVHEILNSSPCITVPDDCYFEWRPSQKGREKSAQRWLRDRDLLLKEHEKNPFDARTLFYLAQTYDCLGDYENAYAYYKKRSLLSSPNEDQYITLFRMGSVVQAIAEKDGFVDIKKGEPESETRSEMVSGVESVVEKRDREGIFDICPLAIVHYLEAFNMRPRRAEPLIKIAQYYLDNDMMDLAFLFAQRACTIDYPKNDRLFVEKYMYDFTRYDILGIAAWYVGEYEVGEWAVRKALLTQPDAPHLLFNLKLYVDRKEI